MTSDNQMKLTLSFEVQTYYPAYRKDNDVDVIVYPKKTKWYSNLIESRNRSAPRNINDNSDRDINSQS